MMPFGDKRRRGHRSGGFQLEKYDGVCALRHNRPDLKTARYLQELFEVREVFIRGAVRAE